MGVANQTKPTSLFIPGKKAASTGLLALERWGQGRPGPTVTALTLQHSFQTITPGVPVEVTYDTILTDGIGGAGGGIQTAYTGGPVFLLAHSVWCVVLTVGQLSSANDDQWTGTIIGSSPTDVIALGPYSNVATIGFPRAGYVCSIQFPNVVVGGWTPNANGNPVSAKAYIQLEYQGSLSSVDFNSTVIITRVS